MPKIWFHVSKANWCCLFPKQQSPSADCLEKPFKVIQLFRQAQLNFWILALPEDKYESSLSRYLENMEHQVFAVVGENREALKPWILIMSFPVQESHHLLWCILYLKTKHWDNLSNLVLPITKLNFSCRIQKNAKPLKEQESCKLFSLFCCNSSCLHPCFFFSWLFCSSFQQSPLLSPGVSWSCWPQEGSAFHQPPGIQRDAGDSGEGLFS